MGFKISKIFSSKYLQNIFKVGVDQLGYEKELGMTPSVMKNDKSWRGMLLKDNDGDWGVAVAAWRGMKKGQPGIPGRKEGK